MQVTASSQIFEFLHPFQWTRIKQQILCFLNDMVLSMTVMWDFIAHGAECEWPLLVRSLSFCTLSSEHVLTSRFFVTWTTWCFQWQWLELSLRDSTILMSDFIAYGAECEWRLFVRSLSFCTLSSEHILSSRFCVTWITWCFQWQWP